jgi:hypothetical protein
MQDDHKLLYIIAGANGSFNNIHKLAKEEINDR